MIAKCFPFVHIFSFVKKEKVSWGQVRWIWWLRYDYGIVFGQKLTHKHRCVSWCVLIMQNPWLGFPQFCAFLTNCLAQSAHNFKVVFLIDRTTLWPEFMLHHANANEENSEKNLHILPKLKGFFRSWFFWMLPLGWHGFGFNVIAIHPVIRHQLWPFWANLDRRQHLLSDVHAT